MRAGRYDDLPLVLRQSRDGEAAPTAAAEPVQAAAPAPRRWVDALRNRWLLAVIVAALVATGLFYPVENVVVASGQVIPSDRVQTVQHLEGGIVTAVHVREGQAVTQGQPLLEIDLGGTSLNLEQLTARMATAQAVKTRLGAESRGRPLQRADFPADLDQQVVLAEMGAFSARALEQQGSIASAQAQLLQARGDVAQVQARIEGLETNLRLHQQEASIAGQLAAEQLIGQLEVLDKQRALEQVRAELAASRQTLFSNRAKIEQAQAKLQETQGAVPNNRERGKSGQRRATRFLTGRSRCVGNRKCHRKQTAPRPVRS
jgi:adhesin transport system membrane fusion protein